MNPNSISHRLFVAALTAVPPPPAKRAVRSPVKNSLKPGAPKAAHSVSAAAQKISEWSWSGWQYPTF